MYFQTGQDPEIQQILTQIYQESQGGTAYCEQMMNALMNLFFVLLLRRYEHAVQLPAKNNLNWKQDYMGIFTFIQNHYSCITLQELSREFGYSERHLNRIIQKYTGKHFFEIVTSLRMKEDAFLLRNTPMSTAEIAAKVGYENLSGFHRAFAKYYGCTPEQYKKAM